MKTRTLTLLLTVTALAASAATFSLNPVADAFVTTGPGGTLSGNNYGGAGAISVSAPGKPNGEFQSLMRYDLSTALTFFDTTFGVGNWTVQSISLQLTAQTANNPIFNTPAAGLLSVSWMQNDTWTEGTGSPASPSLTGVNYDSLSMLINPNDQNLGSLSYNGATSGAFGSSLLLSPGLLGDVQSGSLLSLRLFAGDLSVSGVFPSRTFGTPASRPFLTIDAVAVPEPTTTALVGLAVVCGLGCRIFRRRK